MGPSSHCVLEWLWFLAVGGVVLVLVVVVLLQEPKMILQRLEEPQHTGTFPAGPCCFQPLLLHVWILLLVVNRVLVVAAATAVPERHDHIPAAVVHHGWKVLLVCFPPKKKNKKDTSPSPKVILVLVFVVVLVEKFHIPCILVGFVNTRILFIVPEAGIGPHHQWFSIEVVIVRLL